MIFPDYSIVYDGREFGYEMNAFLRIAGPLALEFRHNWHGLALHGTPVLQSESYPCYIPFLYDAWICADLPFRCVQIGHK